MILMGKESRSVLKLEGEWKQIYSTIIISVYIYRERNHVTIKTKGTLIHNLFDVFIFHGRVYNEVLLIKRNDFEQRTFILGERKKKGGAFSKEKKSIENSRMKAQRTNFLRSNQFAKTVIMSFRAKGEF